MARKITVDAPDVWEYFQKHRDELLTSMHEIASNEEYGIVVYITEDGGLPQILVTADDEEVYSEEVVSLRNCRATVDKVYEDYLTSNVISNLTDEFYGEDDSRMEIEDEIMQREIELDDAIYSLVTVAIGGYLDNSTVDIDEVCEDVKEHTLEYIARKHGLPVYRPMFLEDEGGEEFFEEYPYECMIFDDEDNPIYR